MYVNGFNTKHMTNNEKDFLIAEIDNGGGEQFAVREDDDDILETCDRLVNLKLLVKPDKPNDFYRETTFKLDKKDKRIRFFFTSLGKKVAKACQENWHYVGVI